MRGDMRARVSGALLAGGACLLLAAAPIDRISLGSMTLDPRGLGLAGAPVSALLAFWLAPPVVGASWRGGAGIGAALGVGAAYLGVLEIALATIVAALLGLDPTTGFSDDVTGSLFIAIIGLPYGTFLLPITVPCGLAWAFVVRAAFRRGLGGSVAPR